MELERLRIILSETQPVLGRFLAYATVKVSASRDGFYHHFRASGVTYTTDDGAFGTDNVITSQSKQCGSVLKHFAMRTGPIHVHHETEVH